MRFPKPRRKQNRTETVVLTGGLNEIVTNLELKSGELHQCSNYMELDGDYHGYASIAGYEAYDGKAKPSDVDVPQEMDEGNDVNTVLLIEEPTISDISDSAHTITDSGITIATAHYKFYNYSMEFAAGNYLLIDSVDVGAFSSGYSSAYNGTGLAPSYLNLYDDWTIDFQFRPKTLSGTQTIFEKLYCYKLDISSSGLLTFYTSDDGVSYTDSIAMVGNALSISAFYHIMIVSRDNVIRMFVNGTAILDGTVIETSYTAVNKDASDLYIGRDTAGSTLYSGYISEFRISDIKRRWEDFDPPTVRYSDSEYAALTWDGTDRETQRALITAVPGEGNILGLHVYGGELYALRNAVGSATASLWKATTILDSEGSIDDSLSGWSLVDSTFNPDGRLDAINWAFSGSFDGTQIMLMVDTTSVPRVWDGTTMYLLTSGGVDDATGIPDLDPSPRYAKLCSIFDNRFLLAYSADDIFLSSKTDPRDFSQGFGDQLIVGDDITNLNEMPGESMAIICRNSVKVLEKLEIPTSSTATPDYSFRVKNFSREAGGINYTVERMLGTLLYADDRGIVTLSTSDKFGNFTASSISKKVNRTFSAKKDLIASSMVDRSLNQYRLYYTDGSALIFTFLNEELKGATTVQYDMDILLTAEGEDSDGNIIKFVSNDDGYVYQLDIGTSFNGVVIPTELFTAFYGYKSHRYWKQFRRMVFELTASKGTVFNFRNVFDYEEATFPSTKWSDSQVEGPAGIWGESIWGQFTWGGSVVQRVINYIRGVGTNMSIEVTTSSKYTSPHVIQNVIVDFEVEGLQQ